MAEHGFGLTSSRRNGTPFVPPSRFAAGGTKTELLRRFGVSRRTIHAWIETGQLGRDGVGSRDAVQARLPVGHKAAFHLSSRGLGRR